MTLEEAVRLIESARGPCDLFGEDAVRSYRRLARLRHPDTSPAEASTQAAFRRPYTTWSTTTFANAQTLLAGAGLARSSATRVGVIRCYQTRHGPGPFVTEDRCLEIPEIHNASGVWQGTFRVGHLDVVALRYGLEAAGGADVIALTHLDTAARHPGLRICRGYDIDGEKVTRLAADRAGDLAAQERLTRRLLRARPLYDDVDGDWAPVVEEALGVPVAVASNGPRALDKRALKELLRAVAL